MMHSLSLQKLLQRGLKSRRVWNSGAYTIYIAHNQEKPDFTLCRNCTLSMRCLAGYQVSNMQAKYAQFVCALPNNEIIFYYMSARELAFRQKQREITVYNLVLDKEERVVRLYTYLEALRYNFSYLNLSTKRIQEIIISVTKDIEMFFYIGEDICMKI